MALGESIRDRVVPMITDLIALLDGRAMDVENSWIIEIKEAVQRTVAALESLRAIVSFVFGVIEGVVQQFLDVINMLFGTEFEARTVIITAALAQFLGIFRLLFALLRGGQAIFVFIR